MFITFEGIEGTGKTTQIARLKEYFESRGRAVHLTREPGGSRVGRELRQMLLHVDNADLTPITELFLYLADRAQHVAQVIRPQLEAGRVVLCDRFADSTIVYQGFGRGLDTAILKQLNEVAVDGVWPDLTIVLDIDPEVGLKRATLRNLDDGKAKEEGRFEAEHISFHRRIREGYLTWAALNRDRIRVADASATPDEVFARVKALIETHLPDLA
ncbi:MAG: dTMP kinase [Pseudodesulfovibrio sp.]|uniref:Thymidylate kinase n=1 Tax=Pseudodesulfovibrio aespoeensis (strain ATCC 700646 / DSM 10631 / Aspo-2) TaxID=643562 RepID=E6VYJ8_PSEA9|nr:MULTISPECIES: dTMP kinase [Pseudodesulfovibrio]MBU4191537.1 dTMP kinase [Pseudomonadota bacterium]ADU62761.1 thymidylate kinase [Pseudodesulfovibrio aespoeensis Aspo-2]MBU4245251.1 dTMP kinase [Pseudomonadota bacterium]MBU4380510.1 dTMP kinase [Pseudomonadota bacterium]MBU4474188.1 dTMP kinase [Pseudomonadota bacterium]